MQSKNNRPAAQDKSFKNAKPKRVNSTLKLLRSSNISNNYNTSNTVQENRPNIQHSYKNKQKLWTSLPPSRPHTTKSSNQPRKRLTESLSHIENHSTLKSTKNESIDKDITLQLTTRGIFKKESVQSPTIKNQNKSIRIKKRSETMSYIDRVADQILKSLLSQK